MPPDFPYAAQYFDRGDGIRMAYRDEGSGDPLVMVHGNPTWSYYYRRLIGEFSGRYRCIVPDHVGMGESDKPDDSRYRYTLASRIDDLDRLLANLGVDQRVTLVVHDWGGMIGLGWALRHPERVRRLVVLNTAAFTLPHDKKLPWQLKLGRDSRLGALLIRGFNAFSAGATWLGVSRRMDGPTRRAFTAPYDSWANRISTLRFVQDIPLQPQDASWPLVAEAGERLPQLADRPALLLWGMRDFVFDHTCLSEFQKAWPQAEAHRFEDAGHYVLEDAHERIIPLMNDFLQRHPLD